MNWKSTSLILAVFVLLFGLFDSSILTKDVRAASKVVAFPGAEGGGMYTSGAVAMTYMK